MRERRCQQATASAKRRLAKDPFEYKLRRLLAAAKQRARQEGLPFDIDLEYVRSIAVKVCPVLGIKLTFDASARPTDSSPSLDKFYPEKGYVKGNVYFVSWKANALKNKGNLRDIRKLMRWMAETEEKMEHQAALDIHQKPRLTIAA